MGVPGPRLSGTHLLLPLARGYLTVTFSQHNAVTPPSWRRVSHAAETDHGKVMTVKGCME